MAAAARTLPILPISAFAPKHPSTTSAASSSSIPLSSLSARIPHRHRRLLSTSLFGDAIHLSSAFSPPPAPGSALRSASTAAASATAVLFSLPTAKPERAAGNEKVPNWSSRSIKSFTMGELEARKLKYPNTGTEALLMGILVEGTSHAARFLRANGITSFKVREETVKILGKSDLYFFSPEHPPLTEPAQRALDWAVDERLKSGADGEITTTHLLLGIWSEKESAGQKILATLGFDDEKASELAKSADEEITMSNRKHTTNLHIA